MRRPYKNPPYVQAFLDQQGNARFYFRRPGYPRVPLPGLPWSPSFMAAHEAAMTGKPLDIEKSAPGTVNALVERYYRSAEFINLRPITQKTYRSRLEPFRLEHGDKTVANVRREHVKAILAKLAPTPVVANNRLKMLRILFRFAVDCNMRADNPCTSLRKLKTGSAGYKPWSEEHIAAFYERHPVGSKARLAFDLLLYTGQRRQDVVLMGRQHVQNGILSIRQSKTGSEVRIPLHPALRASLDALPQNNMTFLLTEYGKPFAVAGFGNWLHDRVAEVKDEEGRALLPEGLAAHGLRKAACRRLAEAGCTAPEIMAISGHRSLKEVQTYIDDVNRLRLAESALQKQLDRADSVGGLSK